eukprot:CAMPEP_0201523238 /NCGR_PEP_ID=MMETSP0161_2-20130828/19119_1 /ASSEMBLY_ACC=CAM_ASM_000251 /TAXON_ID=180227 /ORGANISM="Neoparamoeba aestuarina, Strain SoJaBio B1-5/56/2" /LENGTH=218 /DNA_ID=CAMNT_0047922285 /DNA_START=142 /DNA_END=794 /DNA_ORIENTATION=-
MAAVENPNDTDQLRAAFEHFDRDKNSMVTKKEFLEITKILVNEGVIENTQNKKIDKFSSELFDEYDTNKDGILTFADFERFMKTITSPKGQPAFGTSQTGAESQMNNRVMDFYLKYTKREKDGSLKVVGLPSEWIQLFKASGIKPRELKDPENCVFLLDTMEKSMAEIKKNSQAKLSDVSKQDGDQRTRQPSLSARDRSLAPAPPGAGGMPPPPPGPP